MGLFATCGLSVALVMRLLVKQASTMMEVEKELKSAADSLRGCQPSSISLAAACELFMRWPIPKQKRISMHARKNQTVLFDRTIFVLFGFAPQESTRCGTVSKRIGFQDPQLPLLLAKRLILDVKNLFGRMSRRALILMDVTKAVPW